MDTVKKLTVVYEDISPVKNENNIPQDLVEYLYTPVFQDEFHSRYICVLIRYIRFFIS
jgi:hypothetical protein